VWKFEEILDFVRSKEFENIFGIANKSQPRSRVVQRRDMPSLLSLTMVRKSSTHQLVCAVGNFLDPIDTGATAK
jgi:hypothetical protein